MARTHCFLLPILLLAALLLPPCTAEQVLTAPGQLQSGESISFGNFSFVLQRDCRLAVYDGKTAVWSTNTTAVPSQGCVATLKEDGLLAVHDPLCTTQVWQSEIQSWRFNLSYYALVLLPDGEVVIYSKAVWATDTNVYSDESVSSSQVLINDRRLRTGEYLSVRTYRFVMESDCSLCFYDQGKRIGGTPTGNKGVGCYASLDSDGYLRIYDNRANKVWQSTKSALSPSTALVLEPQRQVAIWTEPIWSTRVYESSIRMSGPGNGPETFDVANTSAA